MISRLRARQVFLRLSHDKAIEVLKATARTYGFEITEATDYQKFIRRRTGVAPSHKITLLQIQKTSMIFSSLLMDDIMPLLLPLRLVIREADDKQSVLHFANWDIVIDTEATLAQHCMDKLYKEMVDEITATLRKCLMAAEGPQIVPGQQAQLKGMQDGDKKTRFAL